MKKNIKLLIPFLTVVLTIITTLYSYSTEVYHSSNKENSLFQEYYRTMKNDNFSLCYISPSDLKKAKEINAKVNKEEKIPPQKLLDNWKIEAEEKFIGTLKFSSIDNTLVGAVYFLKYNKWDDLSNLRYNGKLITFDYINPYGVNLHFEGTINKSAKELKGRYTDLNTRKIHGWKAFR